MEFVRDSLDDILMDLYTALRESGLPNKSSRGDTIELLGVALRIAKPRTRISRSEDRGKPFSALGELLWYFARSDRLEFIQEYVPKYKKEAEADGTIHGAYGPRLFEMRGSVNQFANVIKLLSGKSNSRRAVIQLFNGEDLAGTFKEVPCTTTFQFHLRDGQLHMSTTMRSNDAYLGLPHDFFCFTMIQEIVATALRVELGEYYHYAGNMHIYKTDIENAARFQEEGYHKPVEMLQMPSADPFAAVERVIAAESRLRAGKRIDATDFHTEPYWADLIRLMQAYWASSDDAELDRIKEQIEYLPFREFVESRRDKKARIFSAAP